MTGKAKRKDWGGIAYMLCLTVLLPISIGKFVLGASWTAVGIAYGAWFGLLALWGLTSRGTWSEKFGWPAIMSIFFTLPAILTGILLLRELAGIR